MMNYKSVCIQYCLNYIVTSYQYIMLFEVFQNIIDIDFGKWYSWIEIGSNQFPLKFKYVTELGPSFVFNSKPYSMNKMSIN